MANFEVIRIGKCIYCGTSTDILTAEHAIPYGLNGDLILHDASCKNCAKITSQFEMSCLRGLLGPTRAKLNLKTRRPKNVMTAFKVDHGMGWETASVDARQFAGLSVLPWYEPPGFLTRQYFDGEIKVRGWQNLFPGNSSFDLASLTKTSQTTFEFKVDLDVWAFSRMLAKIGYCCAVAHFGLAKMSDIYVLPSIIGTKLDVQTWVGSNVDFKTRPHSLHVVEVFLDGDIIIARVALFAAFGGQPYTVIVGKYAWPDGIRRAASITQIA
jgi:hypothetical protein